MIKNVSFAGFDWDSGNISKCQKHRLQLTQIENFFKSEFYLSVDNTHSTKEDRFVACGKINPGKGIFVAFTVRELNGQYFIRPISARYMKKKELVKYEKEITKIKIR